MEARLAQRPDDPVGVGPVEDKPTAAEPEEGELADSRAPTMAGGETAAPPAGEDRAEAGWPDEAGEAAYLAEAAERGEPIPPAKPAEEVADEVESRPLPDLGELVERIPPPVRETLDDLFRARFVRVTRVPRKALSR